MFLVAHISVGDSANCPQADEIRTATFDMCGKLEAEFTAGNPLGAFPKADDPPARTGGRGGARPEASSPDPALLTFFLVMFFFEKSSGGGDLHHIFFAPGGWTPFSLGGC